MLNAILNQLEFHYLYYTSNIQVVSSGQVNNTMTSSTSPSSSYTPSSSIPSSSLSPSATPSSTTSASKESNLPLELQVWGDDEDGGDPLTMWRGRGAYDTIPSYIVACPLSMDALRAFYKLDLSTTPSFKSQVAKLSKMMRDPPIDFSLPTSLGPYGKKRKMGGYEVRMASACT